MSRFTVRLGVAGAVLLLLGLCGLVYWVWSGDQTLF